MRNEIFERNLEFKDIMLGLPEGIYTIPELYDFIAEKIAGFKSKNTVRKEIIEFVENYHGSTNEPSFELKGMQKLQVLAARNPVAISGSLHRYENSHYSDELRNK